MGRNVSERKRRAAAPLIVAALASAGCWEEIHYAPAVNGNSSDGVAAEAPEPTSKDDLATPLDADRADAPSGTLVETPEAPPIDPPAEIKTATPRERLLAWRAASKWSLAAAAYAKGLDASRYEPLQQEAVEAASELGLELPELPKTDDESRRETTVIASLRTGSGAQLTDAVEERFGAQTGAAARLAVSTHLLLLVYSPQDGNAGSYAKALREAAEAADLPADLWRPLAELLESQAEFFAVRGAVFEFHRQVEEHLGRL
jgi:hypothetical protein